MGPEFIGGQINTSSLQPTGLRLRVLFVDNMKHPVLQMLGTRCQGFIFKDMCSGLNMN
jgi:hypothetical protein